MEASPDDWLILVGDAGSTANRANKGAQEQRPMTFQADRLTVDHIFPRGSSPARPYAFDASFDAGGEEAFAGEREDVKTAVAFERLTVVKVTFRRRIGANHGFAESAWRRPRKEKGRFSLLCSHVLSAARTRNLVRPRLTGDHWRVEGLEAIAPDIMRADPLDRGGFALQSN